MELEYLLSKISGFYDQNIRKFKEEAIGSDEVDHLTLHHWNYVEMIHKLGNPTFTELAERLGVTKPSVTAIANKLIRQGYLYKRQSSEDRRSYHLYLSEKGKRLIEAEHKAVIEFANQIRYALSDAEINQLVEMFKKVVASFSQK